MFKIYKRPVANTLSTYLIGADEEGVIVQSFRISKRSEDSEIAIKHSLFLWSLAINNAESKFVSEFIESLAEGLNIETDNQKVIDNILGLFGSCSVDMSSYAQAVAISIDESGQAFSLEATTDLEEALGFLSRRDYVEVLLH